MQNYNGSNAYEMRNAGGAPRKKPQRKRPEQQKRKQKHIRPNMTVRLNKRSENVRIRSTEGLANAFVSFNPVQLRLLFAAGFAFAVLLMFFAVTVKCQVKDNELSHTITKLESEQAELKRINEALVLKRNKIIHESSVETYAEQKLGMKRRDSYQLKWFTVIDELDSDD